MRMWSGTLEHVSRLQAWHFPTLVRRIPDIHMEKTGATTYTATPISPAMFSSSSVA
jgi:hypothetical protein